MGSTEFAYKKIVERPRNSLLSRVFVWVGTHSVLSGFIGGICVVAFAMASAFEGVKKAPTEALIISALVVLVWTVLVGLMGSFIARQGVLRLEVHRAIRAGDALFRWRENADVLLEIEAPTYTILAAPEAAGAKKNPPEDRIVYLKVAGKGGEFVLQTELSHKEGARYPALSPAEAAELEVDEVLPIALASRVLLYAEREN